MAGWTLSRRWAGEEHWIAGSLHNLASANAQHSLALRNSALVAFSATTSPTAPAAQINQRSRALAPAGSGGVEALASADKRRAKLEQLQREEEERRLAECTFQVGGDCARRRQGRPPAGEGWRAACRVLRGVRAGICATTSPGHPFSQPDTSKPRVKGYYDEYQPPTPGAALSIASAAKQVRIVARHPCMLLV